MYKYYNVAVVKYLLSTSKVNQLAQGNRQRTPIDRISSWSQRFFKYLHHLLTPVKNFL